MPTPEQVRSAVLAITSGGDQIDAEILEAALPDVLKAIGATRNQRAAARVREGGPPAAASASLTQRHVVSLGFSFPIVREIFEAWGNETPLRAFAAQLARHRALVVAGEASDAPAFLTLSAQYLEGLPPGRAQVDLAAFLTNPDFAWLLRRTRLTDPEACVRWQQRADRVRANAIRASLAREQPTTVPGGLAEPCT